MEVFAGAFVAALVAGAFCVDSCVGEDISRVSAMTDAGEVYIGRMFGQGDCGAVFHVKPCALAF